MSPVARELLLVFYHHHLRFLAAEGTMRFNIKIQGSGSLLGLEISTLRTTRSGHAFGSWEEIPTNFSITDTVAAVAVAAQCHEDLAELDTGTPLSLLDKLQSKVKRRDARAAVKALADPLRDPHPSRHQRHIHAAAPPITAQLHLRKTQIAATGFIGLCDDSGCTYRLQDFFRDKPKHKGFQLVKLSGSTPRPIVDRDGKVYAVYGSMPDHEGFMTHAHDPAVQALEAAWVQASLSYEQLHNCRGNFTQILGGDSPGGGQL
ncbi:hypothetical protein K438DRAFT_1982423 [Mycena galopus ATCC 62051]|nr:hypothetical protein K438DRAFT_1982423 [Mycena galopus ATCC 62051]